jgi:hypothetical protein
MVTTTTEVASRPASSTSNRELQAQRSLNHANRRKRHTTPSGGHRREWVPRYALPLRLDDGRRRLLTRGFFPLS